MNPPFSIVFLTTLIGMGQGLFWALYLNQWHEVLVRPLLQNHAFNVQAISASFILLILGLVASVFHLGHPERAWRAVSCWRTSWLSREVLVLPAFMFIIFVMGIFIFFPALDINYQIGHFSFPLSLLVGFIGLIFSIALFVCTSMIYACLPFIQEWHSYFTFINFMLMGAASGFILATALTVLSAPALTHSYAWIAVILCLLAATSRVASLRRNKSLRPKSSIQSAIGVNNPKIVQKSMGSMGGNFSTRHFFHGKKKIFLRSIKWIFLSMVFIIPIVSCLWQLFFGFSSAIIWPTVGIQYLGLIAERWYFFAEAKHPQNIYYQMIS